MADDIRQKLVKLLEPDLCFGCRFAEIRRVRMPNGDAIRRMLHCRRLDCDNWVATDNPTPVMLDDEEKQ